MFGLISAPIDELVYLKTPWWKSLIKYMIFGTSLALIDSINKHSMDTVIELLSD